MREQIKAGGRFCLIAIWATGRKYWNELLRPGSRLAAIVIAAAGIGSYLQAQDIPRKTTWESGAPARTILAIVTVAASVFSVLVILGYSRRLRKENEREVFLNACRNIFTLIQNEAGIQSKDLGVHVWTVTGFPGGRHLVNTATFRMFSKPLPAVQWTKGKGVIGRCWASGVESVDDLTLYYSAPKSRSEFEALSDDDRLGMRWDDFLKTRDFVAIWATPIFRGPQGRRRFGGCLSVDITAPKNAAALLADVTRREKPELDNILAVCHTVLS